MHRIWGLPIETPAAVAHQAHAVARRLGPGVQSPSEIVGKCENLKKMPRQSSVTRADPVEGG